MAFGSARVARRAPSACEFLVLHDWNLHDAEQYAGFAVDWSYTFESFDRLLCSGLNRIWKERTEGLEDLILGFHIYDSLPVLSFAFTPGNKTDHLVDFLSLRLQQLFDGNEVLLPIVKSEPRRIATHEVIHDGIRRFGYFSFFIQLFFSLYRRSTYVELLEIALAAAEAYRAKLHPIALRIRFWTRVHRMFELAILDVKLHRGELATAYLEQMTARGFLDLQVGLESQKEGTVEMEWGDYDVASLLGAEIPGESKLYPIEEPFTQPLEDFPFYSQERLLQFVDACSLFQQERWDLPSRPPMPVAGLVERLPESSLYLSYRQIDDWLHCLVLERGEGPRIFWCFTREEGASDLPPLEQEFANVLRLLRKLSAAGLPVHQRSLAKPADGRQNQESLLPSLAQLHDLVFRQPCSARDRRLSESIGSARYLLIAAGFPLQGIPFSALHDGTSFLIEKHVVAYVPNATWCAQERKRSGRRVGKALVVADPNENLPGSRQEARIVTETLKEAGVDVTCLEGSDATRERLLEGSRRFDLVHFAGHGNFRLEKASFLNLADGELLLDEILDSGWKPAFLFANACRTGQRQVHLLEETLSFAAGTLACGAGATVGSLWRITDETAVGFAREFYAAALSGATVGEAYQAAMKQLIKAGVPVRQWAPFILVGNPQLLLKTRGDESPESGSSPLTA